MNSNGPLVSPQPGSRHVPLNDPDASYFGKDRRCTWCRGRRAVREDGAGQIRQGAPCERPFLARGLCDWSPLSFRGRAKRGPRRCDFTRDGNVVAMDFGIAPAARPGMTRSVVRAMNQKSACLVNSHLNPLGRIWREESSDDAAVNPATADRQARATRRRGRYERTRMTPTVRGRARFFPVIYREGRVFSLLFTGSVPSVPEPLVCGGM